MATVLLLRHARTAANLNGVLAGWTAGVNLDEVGRGQAAAAGARLRGLKLVAVVSSPLDRCLETLAIALGDPAGDHVAPTVDERLGECRYGDWEGRSLKELVKDPLWRVVQTQPSAAVFPGDGAEPLAVTAARAVTAVREWDARVTAEHGADAVWLACSHGDLIKAIAADALGLHLDMFQRIVAEPSSITAIRYDEMRPSVLKLNDTGAVVGDGG